MTYVYMRQGLAVYSRLASNSSSSSLAPEVLG